MGGADDDTAARGAEGVPRTSPINLNDNGVNAVGHRVEVRRKGCMRFGVAQVTVIICIGR